MLRYLDKSALRSTAITVAIVDILFIWIFIPLITALVNSLAGLFGSTSTTSIADAFTNHIMTALFTGFLACEYASAAAIPGWLVMFGIDVVLCVPLWQSQKPTNRILDNQPKEAKTNVYGNTRFLRSASELNDTKLSGLVSATYDQIEKGHFEAGICCGTFNDRVYIAPGDKHAIILAPTRVGKTRRVLLSQIHLLAQAGESLFIFDPKCEIYPLVYSFLMEKEYKINRIDFNDPNYGNYWNIFDEAITAYEDFDKYDKLVERYRSKAPNSEELADAMDGYYDAIERAEEYVGQITSFVFPRDKEHEGDANYWNNGGEAFIKLAIHYVISSPDCPPKAKVLRTVGEFISDFCSPQSFYPNQSNSPIYVPAFELIKKLPYGHPAYQAMRQVQNASQEHIKSFIQTAQGQIGQFSSSKLARMMQDTDYPVDELADEPTATFVIIPQEKEAYKEIAGLYLDQVYLKLSQKAAQTGNRLPVRMNMICEELAQLPPITNFDQRLSYSAGLGIRWILVLQDFAQLDKYYGRDASPTIISNCAVRLFLGTNHNDTANFYEKELGEYTITIRDGSSSKDPYAIFDNSVSKRYSTQRRKRITAREAIEWNVEEGAIVTIQAHSPSVIPCPDISRTKVNAILGLGNQEENRALTQAVRSIPMHDERKPIIQWSPDIPMPESTESEGFNPAIAYDDDERRRFREKFFNDMRVSLINKKQSKKH